MAWITVSKVLISGILACLRDDISAQSLELHSVFLHDSDRNVTRFAPVDIAHGARFTLVRAADDLAFVAIFDVFCVCGVHVLVALNSNFGDFWVGCKEVVLCLG
jgi:hypothetical protein